MMDSTLISRLHRRKHETNSIFIHHEQGQWYAYSSHSSLKCRPLEECHEDRPLRLRARFVFENLESLRLFQANTNPELAWMVEYFSIVRSFNSPIVATVDEIDELYGVSSDTVRDYGCRPQNVPQWVYEKLSELIALKDEWRASHRIDSLTSFGLYSNQGVLEFDDTKYWLMRTLAQADKLHRFLRGEEAPELNALYERRYDLDGASNQYISDPAWQTLSQGATTDAERFLVLSERPRLRINRQAPTEVERTVPLDVQLASGGLAE